MRLLKRISCGLVLTLGLGAAPALAEPTKASVRLDWVPGGEHAFMYLGKERGFFKDEDIDLDILTGQGSAMSVRLVGNGDNDFAFADSSTVARSWEAGVPVKTLHVLWQESPVVIMARRDKGINKLEDICGKKIGVAIQSTTYAMMKAMLRAAKLNCSYQEIPVSGGGLTELVSGSIDALHGMNYMYPVFARERGVDIVEFPVNEYFKNLYAMSFITNEATLKKGDLAERFRRASLKSLTYALDKPEEAIAAFMRANKENNEKDVRAQLPIIEKLVTVEKDGKRVIAEQTLDGWKSTVDTLVESGILKKKLDPEGHFIARPAN